MNEILKNPIEEMLGRPMKKMEATLYDIYKNNRKYHFEVDENTGYLVAVLNKEEDGHNR